MMLLERERELSEFASVLAEAKAGRGGAVAIEANAGLGKTRLLEEARTLAEDAGAAVFSGRATELERDFPFALVRQLFEAPLAALPAEERESLLEGSEAARGALGLGSPADGTHDTFAVLHALYWATAALAERQPLLLVIDDAHWADAGSLDYVGFLLPRLDELPVALVIASRTDEPAVAEGLGRIFADPSLRHLRPAPLSGEATSALLADGFDRRPEPEFAAACHEVSGGNPFLLTELVRTLAGRGLAPDAEQVDFVRAQAPERVAQMVLPRIARLSPAARELTWSLAVLGDDVVLRLVAELAELDMESARGVADELRAVSIFDRGSSLRFVHPLVRNAIYTEMPVGERARMHAEAAGLLREHDAGAEPVATQLLATDPRGDRESAETLLAAGEQALAAGAPRSAIAYLERARIEPPPAELRAPVLEHLMIAGFRAADQSVWVAIEVDALREWEREPALRSAWAGSLTMLMMLQGQFVEASSILREAIEVAVKAGDLARAFELKAQLSTVSLVVPSGPEVDLDDYTDEIEPDSRTGRLVAAMEARSKATSGGTAQEAVAAAKRALAHDGVIFEEDPELVAALFSVMTLVAADEMEAARHAADCGLAIAINRGATPELVRARFLTGFVAWGYGDLVSAEADLRQAIDLARMIGAFPLTVTCSGTLMEVLIERDELEAAEAELEAIGMAAGPIPDSPLFSMVPMIRGHLRFEQGRMDEAVEDFRALIALADRMGYGAGPIATVGPQMVRALHALGEHDQARALVDEITVDIQSWGAPATVAQLLRIDAAARGGEEGIELLEKAVAHVEESPRRLLHAHALADLGTALRGEGRRVDARPPLREAMKVARRCGAARIAKRAAAELEATGETVRRYTPIGVESLTPSERRVADLAASGMTNRQIAQTLFVTVKTVEAHLSAAYDKLDISSRRELPTALEASADASA